MLTLHPISARHFDSYVLNTSTRRLDVVRLTELTSSFFRPCGKLKKLFSKLNRVLTNVTTVKSTLEPVINPFWPTFATLTKSTLKAVKNPNNSYKAYFKDFPQLPQLPIDCSAIVKVYSSVHQPNFHSFCWRQDHLRFELQSDDPAVVSRVREVLRFWNAEAPPVSGDETQSLRPSLVSTVTLASDGYHFTGSQATEPVKLKDIAAVIRAAETDAAIAILNQTDHFLTVHGALLARDDDAVLVVGPSQSGKSTTSCALWAAGWQLLADDVTILHPTDATASPLLRRVSLRHPSRQLLGDAFWQRMTAASTCDPTPEGYVFHPDEIEGISRARSARLRAIIFLRRLGANDPGPGRLLPVIEAQALLALSPYTNVIRHGGMGEAMTRLAPLLNQVPCYDMGRGSLPDMVETIETLLTPEAAFERL